MTSVPTSYNAEISAWRRTQELALRADDGWLTLAGLHWLHEGAQRIGGNPACEIALAATSAPDVIGQIDVHDGVVRFHAAPGVEATVKGRHTAHTTLQTDAAGAPDVVTIGPVSFSIIKRGQRLGVRVRDRNSAARKMFAGRQWYPVDAAYRIQATFHPHASPRTIPITNILGDVTDTPSPGFVTFQAHDQTCRLDATQSSAGGLFFVFRDRTSGSTTYGAGRFLTAAAPHGDQVILDFNQAVSPPCAFTAYATCPLPPPQNHLPVAVEAGEQFSTSNNSTQH